MLKAVRSREQPGRILWAVIFQARHAAACRQDAWRQTALLPLTPRRVPPTNANLVPMLAAMTGSPASSTESCPAIALRIFDLLEATSKSVPYLSQINYGFLENPLSEGILRQFLSVHRTWTVRRQGGEMSVHAAPPSPLPAARPGAQAAEALQSRCLSAGSAECQRATPDRLISQEPRSEPGLPIRLACRESKRQSCSLRRHIAARSCTVWQG